jgi:hypothetical protein
LVDSFPSGVPPANNKKEMNMDDEKLRRIIRGLDDEQKDLVMEFVNSLHFEVEALERSRERFEAESKEIIERLRSQEREVKATRNFLGLMSNEEEE